MRMKKKKHGPERIKLLGALMVDDIKEIAENKEEIYGNDKPLRIEIGCGKGDFVCGKSAFKVIKMSDFPPSGDTKDKRS